jgi:phage terminase large subunit
LLIKAFVPEHSVAVGSSSRMNTSTTLIIPTAKVFEPLVKADAHYLGAWGGRAGKSWFFAEKLVERCLLQPGLRAVCVREVQRTLAQSEAVNRRQDTNAVSTFAMSASALVSRP